MAASTHTLLLTLGVAAAAATLHLASAFGPGPAASCDQWPAAKAFCNGPSTHFEPGVAYPKAKTVAG